MPLVPVMPMTLSFLAGWPNQAAEMKAMAYLVSSTLITVTSLSSTPSTGFDTTRTDAPFRAASAAKAWPSNFTPSMQMKRQPLAIFLES